METKKRLIKGSEEAKQWMANLRALRKGGNKGGNNTPPPAAPCTCPPPSIDIPTETIKKNKSKKNNKIIVDFI